MLSALGIDRTEALLASALSVDRGDRAALPGAYQRFLTPLQPPATLHVGPTPDFVEDPRVERVLLERFLYGDTARDPASPINAKVVEEMFQHRDGEAVRQMLVRTEAAAHTLRRVDPVRGRLFDLLVRRVFASRLRGVSGGTTNLAIGVIWMNPPRRATADDLVEFLVHELAHTLGYIDETAHGHYHRLTDARDAQALSAIRGEPRPLYHVMHSLFVANDLLGFRAERGDAGELSLHPDTPTLVRGCLRSLASLAQLDLRALLTPHGRAVVGLLAAAVDRHAERLDAAA